MDNDRKETLTRADIADKLCIRMGISKREANVLVTKFFEQIATALSIEGQVKVSGLGSFATRSKEARPGTNFHTGEQITIASRETVTLKFSKKLRQRIGEHHGDSQGTSTEND